jgi:hypothetical protein
LPVCRFILQNDNSPNSPVEHCSKHTVLHAFCRQAHHLNRQAALACRNSSSLC